MISKQPQIAATKRAVAPGAPVDAQRASQTLEDMQDPKVQLAKLGYTDGLVVARKPQPRASEELGE